MGLKEWTGRQLGSQEAEQQVEGEPQADQLEPQKKQVGLEEQQEEVDEARHPTQEDGGKTWWMREGDNLRGDEDLEEVKKRQLLTACPDLPPLLVPVSPRQLRRPSHDRPVDREQLYTLADGN